MPITGSALKTGPPTTAVMTTSNPPAPSPDCCPRNPSIQHAAAFARRQRRTSERLTDQAIAAATSASPIRGPPARPSAARSCIGESSGALARPGLPAVPRSSSVAARPTSEKAPARTRKARRRKRRLRLDISGLRSRHGSPATGDQDSSSGSRRPRSRARSRREQKSRSGLAPAFAWLLFRDSGSDDLSRRHAAERRCPARPTC
jgi:hypothetical protein